MSSSSRSNVRLVSGDLLKSSASALVNTVNCVGIMGKGIALAFKNRYPDMFDDYVRRCAQGEVAVGQPYVYRAADKLIVNFPTKGHWRAISRLSDIVAGLDYLEAHYKEWGITSIAVPPLGCGNGQLEWEVVGPTLYRHLSRLGVPVELYVPHGYSAESQQLALDELAPPAAAPPTRYVDPQWVAVVAALDRLERQPYHWPVGRVLFQKLVYFATQAGIPTGLDYEAASYGPFAPDLKRMIARLENNGLAVEHQRGQRFEVRVGPTYPDAVDRFRDVMEPWRDPVERTVDLMARLDARSAEVAASVHFVTVALQAKTSRTPRASEVVEAVEKWKIRRKPALDKQEILAALVILALRRWINVELDEDLFSYVEDLVVA